MGSSTTGLSLFRRPVATPSGGRRAGQAYGSAATCQTDSCNELFKWPMTTRPSGTTKARSNQGRIVSPGHNGTESVAPESGSGCHAMPSDEVHIRRAR